MDVLHEIGSVRPRFILMNYYSALLDYLQALAAIDGKRFNQKEHHKAIIEHLKSYRFNHYELTVLDNLRRIRNDIQYYGTKSEKDITAFYEDNHKTILKLLVKVKGLVKGKL